MSANEITATVESTTRDRFVYTVRIGGEVVDTMTSKVADYAFVNVQRWAEVGATGSEKIEYYGQPERQAYRYSRKPKAVGSKIEYGFCAASVKVEAAS